MEGARQKQQNQYRQTRQALEFLYEEAIRAKSFELAEILLQSLAGCEQLIDANYRPALASKDAESCLFFVRSFVNMEPAERDKVFRMLKVLQ